jgi:threonine dehydratase
MPSLAELEAAAKVVHAHIPPTPQISWPLLSARCGCEVWVKHENHTAIGAFKLRGGLVYLTELGREQPSVTGIISATRGNHGQSLAFAARQLGFRATLVIPAGNSIEKNAAMRALGGELIEHGKDFDEAYAFARGTAQERGLHMVLAFHPWLVKGVASYALEFFRGAPTLDIAYVPIGQGSGICGMIAARDALGLPTTLIGVVAEQAPAYALSFQRGEPVATQSANTMADGVACRIPDRAAFDIICRGVERVVTVSEAEIRAAMRHYFTDTHNVAEGAGAAPLAALLKERDQVAGQRVGLVLSGGNVDRDVFTSVLAEKGERGAGSGAGP